MFPRNLILFRFSPSLDLSDLDEGLANCTLKPVGPMEFSSRGFISPLGGDSEALSHSIDMPRPIEPNRLEFHAVTWIAVGGEDKILPGSVVNDLLRKKLKAIEEQEGRRPGGRERKRLKDDLVAELLPRALVQPTRIDAWLFPSLGVLAVGTSSRKAAEGVVSEIRRALGSFPALPLNAERAPRTVLTSWLAGDALPDGLSLGDECKLEDPADKSAKVQCTHLHLLGDEIAAHLEAGKQATRLALSLGDRVSFAFGEDLVIRKFHLLDAAVEKLEGMEHEDVLAELDARFALFAGEFGELFAFLSKVFSFSAADDAIPSAQQDRAKPARRSALLDNSTVTLSGPGMEPITMTGKQFSAAAKRARNLTRLRA